MSRIPLLFLPGLLCDERLWRGQATALADIADARIADLTQDETIAAMAERALATVEGDFALAALSMGGYVAFEILRRAPERVRRLALFDTAAGLDGPEQAKRRKAGLMSLKIGRFVGVTRRFLPELVHASHVDGPVGRTVMEMAEKVGVDAYRHQLQAILGRVDSRPLLPAIAVPTLVAVGDGDRITPPAEALALHRGIAGSTYHVFCDCGHLPPLEKPEETCRLLRHWLAA